MREPQRHGRTHKGLAALATIACIVAACEGAAPDHSITSTAAESAMPRAAAPSSSILPLTTQPPATPQPTVAVPTGSPPSQPAEPAPSPIGFARACRQGDWGRLTLVKAVSEYAQGGGAPIGLSIRPGGKILVASYGYGAGRLSVQRLRPHGALDESFTPAGGLPVAVHWRRSVVSAVVSEDCSALVLAGHDRHSDFAVTRYRPDGMVDVRFGNRGSVRIPLDGNLFQGPVGSLAVQHDGGFVVAVLSDAFAIARVTRHGVLDDTFGDGGTVVRHFGIGYESASGVTVDGNGDIVAIGRAGHLTAGPADNDIALVRWHANGTVDKSFDGGAVRLHPESTFVDQGLAVTEDSVGRLVVLGIDDIWPIVLRLRHDGKVDPSFGIGGTVRLEQAGGIGPIALQPDGKIVLLSSNAIVRLNRDGTYDRSFRGDRRLNF